MLLTLLIDLFEGSVYRPNASSSSSNYNNKYCNFCKIKGHEEKDCRTKKRINLVQSTGNKGKERAE